MRYIGFLGFAILFLGACSQKPENTLRIDEYPDIFPDYVNVTIPVNIAPLNFKVNGSFDRVYVEVIGKSTKITSGNNKYAAFDVKKWNNMLQHSAGDSIRVKVYADHHEDGWREYNSFSIYVNESEVDPYLAYRLIAPGYQVWSSMGIYQRSLNDFRQTDIVTNRLFPGGCVNCHSFSERNSDQMMFHLRGKNGGTYFVRDSGVVKIDSKPDQLFSGFQYPYWHSGGKYVAFSINNTSQSFHAVSDKRIEVFDSKSDVVVYDVQNNKVLTSSLLMGEDWFETFPTFSPDGQHLYFCSSAATSMPGNYQDVKYNLCRISFDAESGDFGTKVDTLVRVEDTKQSVTFPRISPDGKHLLFTLADYGNFSIWHKEADLFMLDLTTGDYEAMDEVNSNDTESYHSWSSNSRWIVFSSRRVNGLYTMPYIAFVDEDGSTGKPFLLPQKDPDFYINTFYSFNIPEFVNGKINISIGEFDKAYNMEGIKVK